MSQEARIKLLPKQDEAWEMFESPDITEVGYGGAAGGGKTRLGWYLAIYIAEHYPGSRAGVARKELKNLRLTTLAELFVIFAELGYQRDVDYNYNQQDSVIKFPNKSEILLLDTAYSPEDPEYTKFGSLPLTWGWVEESNETPEKAKNILKTRIGRNNKFVVNGKPVEAKAFWLETFNPNKGHVHRDYYKPWKENTLPAYRRFIRALPGDNPYLLPAYIENLKRADKTTRERLLYGNFDYDADPRKLIEYDAIVDLRTNSLDITERSVEKFLINDIARFGGDKIVLGEFEGLVLVGLTVDKYQDTDTTGKKIKDVAREQKIPYSHIISDEDGVGGGVVDGLKGTKGFMGNSKPFDILNTRTGKMVAENYSNMRSQCYFKLSEYINQHKIAIQIKRFSSNIEGYTVEKALSDLEEELDQIKKVDDSGQQTKLAIVPKSDIKEQLGRSPDFADILMMRMYFEFKQPLPAEMKMRVWQRSSSTPRGNPAR